MLSRFFLKRPVFAWVIAIILMVRRVGDFQSAYIAVSAIAPPSIAITSFIRSVGRNGGK